MKKMITICLMVATIPALAPEVKAINSITRFDAFLRANGVTHFVGVSTGGPYTSGIKPVGLRIDWDGTQTAAEITNANNLANTFDWKDINRDLSGFITAIRTEPIFNAQVRNELGKLTGLLAVDFNNPTLAQQDWSDAIANPGNTWLTPAVQAKIVSFATTFNIPITNGIL